MGHGVIHFEIPASDPEKLSRFYTDLFGWQIMKMDMGGTAYYVTMTVESDEDGRPKETGRSTAVCPPGSRPTRYP